MTAAADVADRCSFCREPSAGIIVYGSGGAMACVRCGWGLIHERDDAHWVEHLRLVSAEGEDR